ncbi:tetratricopeptide repeat protein [Nanoarchaeota archaeon]
MSDESIARKVLDLEKDFGADENDYEVVDRTIDLASRNLRKRESPSLRDLTMDLAFISSIFREIGFKEGEITFFNKGLKSYELDCASFSYLYLSIAEKVGLPITGVLVQEHIVLQGKIGDQVFYWEPTEGRISTIDGVLDGYNVHIDSFEKGVYLTPLNHNGLLSMANLNIGYCSYYSGNIETAEEYTDRSLELNPNYSEAHHNKGLILLDKGQHEEARNSFNKSIELNPFYYAAFIHSALLESGQGNYEEAMSLLRKAMDIDPNRCEAFGNMGSILSDLKRYDDALMITNRAISMSEGDFRLHNIRGEIYLRRGMPAEAIEDFDKAIEINPSNSVIFSNRAEAYMKLGETDKAKADLAKAESLGNE